MVRNLLTVLGLLIILSGRTDLAFGQQPPIDYFAPPDQASARIIKVVEDHHIKRNDAGKSVYDLIGQGDYRGAFAEVDFILRWVPNHPLGLQIAGTISRLAGRLSVAVSYYEKALNLYPQHAVTYAQFGQYLLQIDQVDNGIEQLKRAVEIDPKLAAGYALLASAYSKKGNGEHAREAADKARQLGYKGQLPSR